MLVAACIVLAAGSVLAGTLTHTTEYAWAGGALALLGILVQLFGLRLSRLGHDALSWVAAASVPSRLPDAPAGDESHGGSSPQAGATVLVIPGRTRFHTHQCSVVQSRSTEEIDVDSAQAVGLTPCGRCAS